MQTRVARASLKHSLSINLRPRLRYARRHEITLPRLRRISVLFCRVAKLGGELCGAPRAGVGEQHPLDGPTRPRAIAAAMFPDPQKPTIMRAA